MADINDKAKLTADDIQKINSEVKVKTTGLGAIFGHIQQNKEVLAKETKSDDTVKWDIPLDKLCDIGHGLPKAFKSQRVSSYYCETCSVDLNSEVTYNTHITGAKHKKKERNRIILQERAKKGEEITLNEELRAPPLKKAKKTHDFREMVRECDEPFVGLQHIIEIFPLDDSGDNDAMYSCELCCSESTAAGMYSHVKGYKHREKYLGMKYNVVTDDKKRILAEARRVENLEGKRLEDVDTIFDDERYPWPPGKKPVHLVKKDCEADEVMNEDDDNVSQLQSNNGSITRNFARRGYNFDKHKEKDTRGNLTSSTVANVLKALQASRVKSEEDAEMAHQVSAHLIKALTEYKELTGDIRESRLIKMKSQQILDILHEIRNVSSIESRLEMTKSEWMGSNVVEYGHGQTEDSGSSYTAGHHRNEAYGSAVRVSACYPEDRLQGRDDYQTSLGCNNTELNTRGMPAENDEYSQYKARMIADRGGAGGISIYSTQDEAPPSVSSRGYNFQRVEKPTGRGFQATLPSPIQASRPMMEDNAIFGRKLPQEYNSYR